MPSSSRVIIFHGTGGAPESNWFPWLAQELGKRGLRTLVPRFPTPEGQSLDNWRKTFREQVGTVAHDMVFVGHSVGCGMILRLLEESPTPVTATFLVAGWTGMLNNPDFDPLIESFFDGPFDWPIIKRNAGPVTMYHGDDDPYVPLSLGRVLSQDIGAKLNVIPHGGHLNAEAGYLNFDLLLTGILGRAVMCC